jgi:serine/threonine-protein kinase
LIVKRLLPHFMSDPEGRAMFDREAQLHAAVRHPNVVSLYDWGVSDDGEPYLALEYVDGVDLFRLLRRLGQEGRGLPVGIAVWAAREVLSALSSVHSAEDAHGNVLSIVHRDVTPSNIYLSKAGEVKLGDFGIARASARASLKTAESAMLKGKFAYLAPEQVAGDPFDHRADLFAMAAVLVEMILGKPLFSGSGQLAVLLAIRDCRLDPLDAAKPRLPQGLFDVLARALARDPQTRYASASALSAALAPFAEAPDRARVELASMVEQIASTPSVTAMAAVRESVRTFRAAVARTMEVDEVELDADVEPDPDGWDIENRPSRVRRQASRFPEAVQDQPTGEYTAVPAFVLLGDGTRLGPWSFARLVEALATGQIGRGDQVDYLARGFLPIEEIDELARFMPAKTATSAFVAGLGAPDFADDLSTSNMLDILMRILEGAETGVLFVERDAIGDDDALRKELYFIDGRLHHVASSNASELLGEYLVRRGMLSRSELDFALAVLSRYNGRIGDTLISLGLVSAVDMFRAIRDQGRDRVGDIFTWRRGRVSFYRGQTAPHVEFPLDLELPPLLLLGLETAHAVDEEATMREHRLRLDAKVVATSDDRHFRIRMTWPPLIGRVLEAAAEPRTMRDLVARLARNGEATAADVFRAADVALAARLLVHAF